jgi:hypothetical protein
MIDQIDSVRSTEICPENPEDKKCAPGIDFKDGSCMSLRILIEMAEAYNMENNSKIKLHPHFETLNPSKYKRYIVREFKNRLKPVCDNQKCWTKQKWTKNMEKKIKEEMSTTIIRPSGPQGKFEWLNTININDVMAQYQNKYKDFKFLGAVPVDFDDLPSLGIANLNFADLQKNGINRIGIIFNLDEHYKSGSHWVASFANLQEGHVYFFDSYGTAPEPRIRKFMRRVVKFADDYKKKNIIADHNKTRHQYQNSECGVYSINFIVRMLRGDTFKEICDSKVPDNVINKCRRVYFSNVNKK